MDRGDNGETVVSKVISILRERPSHKDDDLLLMSVVALVVPRAPGLYNLTAELAKRAKRARVS